VVAGERHHVLGTRRAAARVTERLGARRMRELRALLEELNAAL
jgi:hypothetical protein